MLSSPKNQRKFSPPSKWQRAEKLMVVIFTFFALCKLPLHKQPHGACGKGLWKSLWILWKSIGFPQVNRCFPNPATGFALHNFLYNSSHNSKMPVLRNQVKTGNRTETFVKKVVKKQKPRLPSPAPSPMASKFFVKTAKVFPVSFFPAGK